jgi:hypothetical protein
LHIFEPGKLGRHILLNSRSKAAFCFVPKIGCTNLKILFFIAQGNAVACSWNPFNYWYHTQFPMELWNAPTNQPEVCRLVDGAKAEFTQ